MNQNQNLQKFAFIQEYGSVVDKLDKQMVFKMRLN